MLGDVEVQQAPPVVGEHDEDEEDLEGRRGVGQSLLEGALGDADRPGAIRP